MQPFALADGARRCSAAAAVSLCSSQLRGFIDDDMRRKCEQHAVDEVKHDDRGRCDGDDRQRTAKKKSKKSKEKKKKEKRKPALRPYE
jgi:hypothetical protein